MRGDLGPTASPRPEPAAPDYLSSSLSVPLGDLEYPSQSEVPFCSLSAAATKALTLGVAKLP